MQKLDDSLSLLIATGMRAWYPQRKSTSIRAAGLNPTIDEPLTPSLSYRIDGRRRSKFHYHKSAAPLFPHSTSASHRAQ